jgi:hypothetical protein
MPFRVLAGIILMLEVVAVGGIAFFAWRGAPGPGLTFGDALGLPLLAWFARFAYHAAVHGTSPPGAQWWPFASFGVWNFYSLLLMAYWLFWTGR